MKELIAFLATALSITIPADAPEADITNLVKAELDKQGTTLKTAQDEVARLTAENTTLKADSASTQLGKDTLIAKRAAVEALYTKTRKEGVEPEASILAAIKAADMTLLAAFEKEYQTLADELYPMQCGDCQSTNVARSSVQMGKTDPTIPPSKSKTTAEAISKLKQVKPSTVKI